MARVYPPELVKGILKAIKQQMKADGEYREVNALDAGPSPDDDPHLEDYEDEYVPKFENKGDEQIFFDEITGVQLETEEVLKARQEELAWVKKQEVYVKRPISECWAITGKAPITLKWIDRNKGDSTKKNYRSRLVVRGSEEETWFTPRTPAVFEHAAIGGGEATMLDVSHKWQ